MNEVLEKRSFQVPGRSAPDSAINLSELYPISKRVLLKKSLAWIVSFLIMTSLFLLVRQGVDRHLFIDRWHDDLLRIGFLLMVASGLGAGIRISYEALLRWSYSYKIEGGHFYIKKGILLKQRGAFPLFRITDIYLDRNFPDLLFNLCNLHLSTATTSSGQFARIDGLSYLTAMRLQTHLTSVLERSHATHAEYYEPRPLASLTSGNAPRSVARVDYAPAASEVHQRQLDSKAMNTREV